MDITLFKPVGAQTQIVEAFLNPNINYIIVAIGRRGGKTVTNLNMCVHYALSNNNAKILYILPSAEQVAQTMSAFLEMFKDAPFVTNVNRKDHNVFLGNNSIIKFRIGSMPTGFNLKGGKADMVVLDEAVLLKSILWEEIVAAMILTTPLNKLKVLITSTVRNRDWFFNLYQMGLDPNNTNYVSIMAPTSSNPLVTAESLDEIRKQIAKHIFDQEYLCKWSEDSGGLFENINLNTLNKKHIYDPKVKYFAGIDVAMQNDYTVCVIINQNGEIVDWLRINKLEMKKIVKQVFDLLKRWGNPWTYVEINTYQSFIDDMKELGYRNIEPFWTGVNKKELIEDLIVHFQEGTIKIPNDEYFVSEFFAFSFIWDPKKRNVTYQAPTGLNDDIVMATSFAFKCKKDRKIPTIKTRLIQ